MQEQTEQSNSDLIPVTVAAREFQRTRQAIEALIRTGQISSKKLGAKCQTHVSRNELLHKYAIQEQAKRAGASIANDAKPIPKSIDTNVQIELVKAQSELRRLADLLARSESDLHRERERVAALEVKTLSLEQERTQHLAEMRALLSGKNEGILSIKRWIGK